jgi:hypothetical protein
MTKDEILNMQADRELDALVAEKVMGWVAEVGLNDRAYWVNKNDQRRYFVEGWDHWNPSERISHAWQVVEKMKQDNPEWFIDVKWHAFDKKWSVVITDMHVGYNNVLRAYGRTAPLAICRAALLAVNNP